MASSSSCSSFFVIEPLASTCDCEICRHAMDSCSLCGKRLARDCDIYMYRGDTPFCSEECRCHQILWDEQARAQNSKALKDHLTSNEQQRHRHETPAAAAESGRVKIATNVSVAT
ncbi:hypothetical protein QOZ80_2BG0196930 [Eleusine coracana subsp. coracana]|nr:hypothetical protein QOZ80_2BG0196930 [Eleusine coracana subsp. coracana]